MIRLLQAVWPDWHDGHFWDEEKAETLGLAEEGYYLEAGGPYVLTPEDAEEIFFNHNWKGNRRFSHRRANHLSDCMGVSTDISIAIGRAGCTVKC